MMSNGQFMVGVAVFAMSLAALPGCKKSDEGAGGPTAELRNAAGEVVGEATFERVDNGVRIQFEGKNLPPGTHGFHIHENGECTPPTFETAGNHFNPTAAQHGLQNPQGPHGGDLPNLEVDANGTGRMDYVAKDLTLEPSGDRSLVAGNGTALVIHESADDQVSDPSGNSGGRIACGVIRAR